MKQQQRLWFIQLVMGEGTDDPWLKRCEFEMNKTIYAKTVAESKGEVQS